MAEAENQGSPLIDPTVVKPTVEPTQVDVAKPAKSSSAQLWHWGTGRRKSSVARVRICPGSGKLMINGREVDAFFPGLRDRNDVRAPLVATSSEKQYDVFINLRGGGTTGQAGAASLGLARAMVKANPDCFAALRDNGFLTRDSRMVERKKYGQKGARRRFQFSKR